MNKPTQNQAKMHGVLFTSQEPLRYAGILYMPNQWSLKTPQITYSQLHVSFYRQPSLNVPNQLLL